MGQTGVVRIIDLVLLPCISFIIAFTALECREGIGKHIETVFIASHIYFLSLLTPSHLMAQTGLIKRPARDACLCMGELPAPPAPAAPPAPHFVFLITL